MNFTSRSQAGQDLFVYKTLVQPENLLNGTFLDIGAGHHIELSNSYELEQLGWTGYLLEQDAYAAGKLREHRKSVVMEADARSHDWRKFPRKDFDYLSLDIDYISHQVLLEMLIAGLTFRLATIEHNEYNYPAGDSPRWAVRALMAAKGYRMVASDVKCAGAIFEDWFAHPSVPPERYERFISEGIEGTELAKR